MPKQITSKELLKYNVLSEVISGNSNSIRANKCPKIHQEKVKEIEGAVDKLIKKHQKK